MKRAMVSSAHRMGCLAVSHWVVSLNEPSCWRLIVGHIRPHKLEHQKAGYDERNA